MLFGLTKGPYWSPDDGEGEADVRVSPAAGPPDSVPPVAVPFLALFSVRDCFLVLDAPEPLPDFVLVPLVPLADVPVCAPLPVVVVEVSVVFVQAVANANPMTAVRVRRRDFFIGMLVD